MQGLPKKGLNVGRAFLNKIKNPDIFEVMFKLKEVFEDTHTQPFTYQHFQFNREQKLTMKVQPHLDHVFSYDSEIIIPIL